MGNGKQGTTRAKAKAPKIRTRGSASGKPAKAKPSKQPAKAAQLTLLDHELYFIQQKVEKIPTSARTKAEQALLMKVSNARAAVGK